MYINIYINKLEKISCALCPCVINLLQSHVRVLSSIKWQTRDLFFIFKAAASLVPIPNEQTPCVCLLQSFLVPPDEVGPFYRNFLVPVKPLYGREPFGCGSFSRISTERRGPPFWNPVACLERIPSSGRKRLQRTPDTFVILGDRQIEQRILLDLHLVMYQDLVFKT